MPGTSIKGNFAYSSILTVANYLFPLIIYPYVSRVLGVTNIGICNFVDSIVNYFILFSTLGISYVGIREVSASKGSQESLNSVFSTMVLINAAMTLFAVIIYIIVLTTVPALQNYHRLLYYGIFKLVFNFLLFEWFYKGLEDFKYITIRSICVRTLYVILVFILVRDEDDSGIYYLLGSITVIINAIINSVYSKKFTHFTLRNIQLKRYIKPLIIIGIYIVLTSMYTSFNVTYLGFVSGDREVGYYSTSVKIYSIILAFFTAFTGVMLPRISHLISEGKMDAVKLYFSKSIDVLLLFSLPSIVFCIVCAPQIVMLISGAGYEGAILPMRIVMPLILVIGYEQVLVYQLLMPAKQDNFIFRNSLFGAVVGVLLNIILVKSLGSVGSAVVWVASELIVLALSQISVSKSMNIEFPLGRIIINIAAYIPLLVILYFMNSIVSGVVIPLFLSAMTTLVYVIVMQRFILKNPFYEETVLRIKTKVFGNGTAG